MNGDLFKLLSLFLFSFKRKNSNKQEFKASHLQPTQSPMLKYLDTISSHTDHMLLLDVHHLKDGNSRYYTVFKTIGLSKVTSPPLHCPHKSE